MEIVNLPVGKPASAEVDCIRIEEQPDGRFELTGNALALCNDSEEPESISIVSGEPYASYDTAQAAGVAWANELSVKLLYVSRSNGIKPLPDPT